MNDLTMQITMFVIFLLIIFIGIAIFFGNMDVGLVIVMLVAFAVGLPFMAYIDGKVNERHEKAVEKVVDYIEEQEERLLTLPDQQTLTFEQVKKDFDSNESIGAMSQLIDKDTTSHAVSDVIIWTDIEIAYGKLMETKSELARYKFDEAVIKLSHKYEKQELLKLKSISAKTYSKDMD